MRRDPAIVDLNHLVQTPHSATLLLLVHLASIPGVSTPPLVLSARVPQFKCAKESVRYLAAIESVMNKQNPLTQSFDASCAGALHGGCQDNAVNSILQAIGNRRCGNRATAGANQKYVCCRPAALQVINNKPDVCGM